MAGSATPPTPGFPRIWGKSAEEYIPPSAQAALVLLVVFLLGLVVGRSLTSTPSLSSTERSPSQRLDLNRASANELMLLPGVGEALARQIEDHRQQHGPFRRLEDVTRVPGMGPATLERIQPHIYLSQTIRHETSRPAFPTSPGIDSPTPLGRISLNHASPEELQKLPGIGPVLSRRIVEYREKRQFQSIEEIRKVPGIGPKTFEKIKPFLTVKTGLDSRVFHD